MQYSVWDLLPRIAAHAIQSVMFIITLDSSSSDICNVGVVEFDWIRFPCSDNLPYTLVTKRDHYGAYLNIKRTKLITNEISVSQNVTNKKIQMILKIQMIRIIFLTIRTLHPKRVISVHSNINGFRNIFLEASDLLSQRFLNLLFVF